MCSVQGSLSLVYFLSIVLRDQAWLFKSYWIALKCGKYEVEGYKECAPTCDRKGQYDCTHGTRACICKEHYVRNKEGDCEAREYICRKYNTLEVKR